MQEGGTCSGGGVCGGSGHGYILQVELFLYTTGNACHRAKLILMYFKKDKSEPLKCLKSERRKKPPLSLTLKPHNSPKFQQLLSNAHLKKGEIPRKLEISKALTFFCLFVFVLNLNRTDQTWKCYCSEIGWNFQFSQSYCTWAVNSGFIAGGSQLWELWFCFWVTSFCKLKFKERYWKSSKINLLSISLF